MSGRYYEAANDTNMYNLSSDTSRSSPLGSPNPPRSTAVKREGFHESYSAPSLGRDTPKGNAEEGNKREEQYVAWVNSQLKKRPNSRFVREIPRDTRDGVALVQLVEVLSGETLKFDESPASYAVKKENVDQVLHFMAAHRIKMRQISSKEIVDGNAKATMRLVLALAAHFKPTSVKPSAHQSVQSATPAKLVRSPSAAAAAAEAAAAIGEASRKHASAGRHIRMPFKLRKTTKAVTPGTPKLHEDLRKYDSSPGSSPLRPSSPLNTPLNGTPVKKMNFPPELRLSRDPNSGGSNASSGTSTPRLPQRDLDMLQSFSDTESVASSQGRRKKSSACLVPELDFLPEVIEGYDDMEEEVNAAKVMIHQLQTLLLNGRVEDDEVPEEYCGLEGSTSQEQLTIVSSRLDQREAEYDSLKTELNKTKEECINLQGVKAGLLSRLNQQEHTIMQLQSDTLKQEFLQQQQKSEIAQLQWQLAEKDKELANLRNELLHREKTLDKQRAELEKAARHAEELQFSQARAEKHADDQIILEFQQKIKDLQAKLNSVGSYGASISARIASQDEKMASLEDRILNPHNSAAVMDGLRRSEELEVVREALEGLRSCFRPHDPHHHTLDTLEQSISSILSSSGQHIHSSKGSNLESTKPQGLNGFDHSNGYTASLHLSNKRLESSHSSETGITTKVLYFTEKSVTPFLTSIPKRLEDITLGDFKEAIDRPGMFRYHFKALDPEFGTVKEEVIDNDDNVPGWEGKIVAWVEDDTSQSMLPHHEQNMT